MLQNSSAGTESIGQGNSMGATFQCNYLLRGFSSETAGGLGGAGENE